MSDKQSDTIKRKMGGRRDGAGRPRGSPNKATSEARQAIALFVDQNAHRLAEWLDRVADGDPEHDQKPNPAKAFELFQSVIEYHVPKLARNEHTGADSGPLQVVIQRFGDAPDSAAQ